MATSISVIVPFYGASQTQRLDLVTKSILSQEGVDVDFVVAGLKTSTPIKELFDLSKHPIEDVPEIVRNGAIINNGLRLARGEFIYITDADVLFSNKQYFGNLVQEFFATETPLKRPPMRRLLIEDFNWFYLMVSSKGLEESLKELDTSQKFIVKPRHSERSIRVFPKFENRKHKIFIASESDFQEYISDEKNKGSEPRYFNQDRHCGAVFAHTRDMLKIGGYHEGFIGWGVWDADAQWKLESQVGMNLIPDRQDFSVIHLDHKKGYFSKSKWEHDRKLQERRRTLGFEACVREDLETYLGEQNDR